MKIRKNQIKKYRKGAQWGAENPTQLIIKLNEILKNEQITNGTIIDAGAGFGRNSVFLGKENYKVIAVEYDAGAIPDLKKNIKLNSVSKKVKVVNDDILNYIKKLKDDSVLAVVDSGMSHNLNDSKKKKFAKEVKRTLKPGGYFVLVHFSENEPFPNHKMGRPKKSLERLFPKKYFEVTKNWEEESWEHKETNSKHFAWKVILKKQNETNLS